MNSTNHLNDEQMYALLDDATNSEAQTHLLACADCRNEFADLQASLTNFRGAATNMAAAQTPALAQRSFAVRPAKPSLAPRFWAASLATAALLIGVSVSVFHTGTSGSPIVANETAQVTPAAVSDDALLDGIQRDLSTSVPPSLEPLQVAAGSSDTFTQN